MADKNILIVSSEFPPNVGGIGNHAFNVARFLQLEGYRVKVLCDLVSVNSQELTSFKVQQQFEIIEVVRHKLIIKTYFERVIKSIKYSKNADVIICTGKFSVWLVRILKPLYSKKKFIAVVHGSELLLPNLRHRQFTNNALSLFNNIIAVSGFTKSLLTNELQQKTEVIPNGINNNEFEKYKLNNNSIVSNSDSLNLVTVGSVTERKGQENVIKAMPSILAKFPNAHYHILGKPTIQKELQEIIVKLNIESAVTFYGMVSREFLIMKLNECHIKLMLSNNTNEGDVEGFGIAVLEANALSKPAIGSNNNGIKDAIADNETGKLVNAKNSHEITDALDEILKNYSKYSFNAKCWAAKHDWSQVIKKYVHLIETSLSS